MTTKFRGDKVQALLCNQMSAGFADLAAAILRLFLSPRTWLEPWWSEASGGIGKKVIFRLIVNWFPCSRNRSYPLLRLGRSQCPVCYLCLQGFWTVNIPIELIQKDLMDEAEMFVSLYNSCNTTICLVVTWSKLRVVSFLICNCKIRGRFSSWLFLPENWQETRKKISSRNSKPLAIGLTSFK